MAQTQVVVEVEQPKALANTELITRLETQYIKLLESKIAKLQTELIYKPENVKNVIGERPIFDDNASIASKQSEYPVKDSQETEENPENLQTNEDSRYVVIISRWDPYKGEFVDSRSEIKAEAKFIGPKMKPNQAFTFRKITRSSPFKEEISVYKSQVEVNSEPLQRLLGKITKRYGEPERITEWASPYASLVYSWDEADELSKQVIDDEKEVEKQAHEDLKELLRIISTSSGDAQLDRYFKDQPTFKEESSITHIALWTLFPPGTLVVARPCLGQTQLFSVVSCSRSSSRDPFELLCFIFDWTGSEFCRVPFQFKIDHWGEDRKSIVELPVYPLKYYREEGKDEAASEKSLRCMLIERGENYKKYCTAKKGEQRFNYYGEAYLQKGGVIIHPDTTESSESTSSDTNSLPEYMLDISRHTGTFTKEIEGGVMVDFASYFSYQPANAPILGAYHKHLGDFNDLSPQKRSNKVFKDMYKFDWDGQKPNKDMTEEQYLLCPPRVLGYALKQKTWAQLLVNKLKTPDQADSKTYMEKLQLESDSKDLIKKSVIAHEIGKKRVNGQPRGLEDFAPEKGKGLVIMLYGLPGVGKTLTAESVAQLTGKPLLSIGVSDIGIEGDKVERNLQRIFDLAGIWEAVLLFDEADVFLEARGDGQNDLKRNAMVSVLLRVLEYYDGILILTTNRMRSFDIAVQSRIHLAVKYGGLSSEQKESIYISFLDQLKGKSLLKDYDDIKNWVNRDGKRFDFNGRQIRNVISTALGIALADNRKLDRDDLSSVARQTDDFKRDLASQEAVYKDKQINMRYG